MRPSELQRQLERIYELDVDHDVEDFLITDRKLLRILEAGSGARDVAEKLLVCESGDELELSLYLDAEVLERLDADDPGRRLHAGNLEAYWTALEGVSHFLYLVWNAGHERGVSLLELELQAEVDKYVSSAMLLGRQEGGRVPAALHSTLFEAPTLDPALDPTERRRYREANYYAGKFCARLEDRYLRQAGRPGMMNELRRFYRYTQRRKIDCIEAA